MNKLYLACLGVCVSLAFFAVMPQTISAENCKNNICATLITTGGNGQPASAKIENKGSVATEVAFYTYKVFVQPFNEGWGDQELYQYKIVTLAPGEKKTVSINNPDCMAQFDVHVGYPEQSEQTILIGDFNNNTNLCIRTPVTVSGRVTKCGQGVSGAAIETCTGSTVYTDSNGYWSISTFKGKGYCARVSLAGVKGVNNNSCNPNNATYEWQIAGENRFIGCNASDWNKYDRNSDSNVDFVIDCPETCTDECSDSGQRVCSATAGSSAATMIPIPAWNGVRLPNAAGIRLASTVLASAPARINAS